MVKPSDGLPKHLKSLQNAEQNKQQILERFLLILNRCGIPTGAVSDSLCSGGSFHARIVVTGYPPSFQVLHQGVFGAGDRPSPADFRSDRRAVRGLPAAAGNLTPAVNSRGQGHGRPAPCEGFFAELAEQNPDITLKQLQAALLEAHGVRASLSGIDVVLRRPDLQRFHFMLRRILHLRSSSGIRLG